MDFPFYLVPEMNTLNICASLWLGLLDLSLILDYFEKSTACMAGPDISLKVNLVKLPRKCPGAPTVLQSNRISCK